MVFYALWLQWIWTCFWSACCIVPFFLSVYLHAHTCFFSVPLYIYCMSFFLPFNLFNFLLPTVLKVRLCALQPCVLGHNPTVKQHSISKWSRMYYSLLGSSITTCSRVTNRLTTFVSSMLVALLYSESNSFAVENLFFYGVVWLHPRKLTYIFPPKMVA